jgi:hypothetical protein
MVNIIESYSTENYILSHESLCDRKEMINFWNDLRVASQIVADSKSDGEGISKFIDKFKRDPSKDEAFFINCFVNVNKAKQ